MEAAIELSVVDIAALACKLLMLLALLQSIGLSIFVMAYRQLLDSPLATIARLNTLSALAAAVLVLALQLLFAARMSGEWSGILDPALQRLAWESPAGAATAMRILAMLLLAFAIRRGSRSVAMVCVVTAIVSFAVTGHIASHPSRWLLAPLLCVHVLIVAYWFGSLPALVLSLKSSQAPAILSAFSRHATALVPIIALAGIGLASAFLSGWSELATSYGSGVLIKANLFALLLAIAAYNKLRLVPQLQSGSARARGMLRGTMMLEYALIAAVLAATSVITTVVGPE